MIYNIYQGDPKLFLFPSGSDLEFRGGQPIMDGGLENTVFISLFTRKGWIGNTMFGDTAYHIGSDFELAFEQPINIGALDDIQQEAGKALQWMIDVNLASNIDIVVSNPTGERIDTKITIHRPNLPASELVLIKNGSNWLMQRDDPAYRRFR